MRLQGDRISSCERKSTTLALVVLESCKAIAAGLDNEVNNNEFQI